MNLGWERILETLCSALGEEGASRLEEESRVVRGRTKPTVLLLGPYSAGKTSVAVRLLQEAGLEVPASLSVGAAPETYVSQALELPWCILQDTPGLGSGRAGELDELRARALESDLALLCLPPSGWQASLSDLDGILKPGQAQSIPCALLQTRADEAGPEVEIAPAEWNAALATRRDDALAALAARRIQPLPGAALAVACHPYGLPDLRTGWDGVSGLVRFLEALAESRPLLTELTASRRVAAQVFELLARLQGELAERQDLRDLFQVRLRDLEQAMASVDGFRLDRENGLRSSLLRLAEALVRARALDEQGATGRMVESAKDWWRETEAQAVQLAERLEVELERSGKGFPVPPALSIPPAGAPPKAAFKSGVEKAERLWPKVAQLVPQVQSLRTGVPIADLRASLEKLSAGGLDQLRGKADRWVRKHPQEARFHVGLDQVIATVPQVLALLSAAAEEGRPPKEYVRQRLRVVLDQVVQAYVGERDSRQGSTLRGLCTTVKESLVEQAQELSDGLARLDASVKCAEETCHSLHQAAASAEALLAADFEETCGALARRLR